MKELNFETGLVTYNLNGKCEITINPTDSAFIGRLYDTFETLDRKQEQYRAEIEKADKKEIFEIAQKRNAEMREMIDGIFDTPICEILFGKMNVYALANGLPVWCNLMLAIMDECDSGFAAEQKLTHPRVAKYTAKYHKS